jgi:hypothetical protein
MVLARCPPSPEWSSRNSFGGFPTLAYEAVRRLAGLEIRTCRDLRSVKKLVPALEEFPRAFIATADDDLEHMRRPNRYSD